MPQAQKRLASVQQVTVTGRLDYQPCDDKLCFAPASVPLSWALQVQPLVGPH